MRASVGQPLRLAAAAPADAGAWVDAIAAHAAASRQAERDAEAFRRNAPPPDDDTRYFQGREPLFLYRAPSDAAPVVRRLARDAFVEARATVLGDGDSAANFLRTPGGLWARVPAEDAVEVVEGRLFPTSATYVRRRGAAASLVASYPTRLFASAHLLEATTIEASGVFATATGEFLRLADGSGWVPLADEGGNGVVFFARAAELVSLFFNCRVVAHRHLPPGPRCLPIANCDPPGKSPGSRARGVRARRGAG